MASNIFRKFQEVVKNGTPLQYVGGGINSSSSSNSNTRRTRTGQQSAESSLSFIGNYLAGWKTIEILLNGSSRRNATVLMDHVENQRKTVGMNPLGLIRLQSWDDFFASFKAAGLYMNILAIAQVLALAIPYHDSRNPAHDADLAYYSLWAFMVIHLLLWYQFLTLLSSNPLYCSLVVVLITAHASFRTREWSRVVKDTIRKRNGQASTAERHRRQGQNNWDSPME
ncbi:hypothetical protein Pmar_PMAR021896 [Perkinsus marinus ATCC 50983]|uniref:Uncharacterized protein n=1 Tax=Perkinsus marinus (strain ATCC 50983 / TXsc) TaxID=423536 RepID=C5LLD9_PERM5|nr:hypothetical protein Pmar_PMAR021896 [Perkinsus marinus ATCC 50983]EER02438.1 hypothetical protein Pmar_PMAR021896 [Perkinsus marinus ATCC 50983]|eukprot:XP_002769720.1 hypothetical protein Pmar_PMAR021896 [Perkinsus marinus ATCC 50983]